MTSKHFETTKFCEIINILCLCFGKKTNSQLFTYENMNTHINNNITDFYNISSAYLWARYETFSLVFWAKSKLQGKENTKDFT